MAPLLRAVLLVGAALQLQLSGAGSAARADDVEAARDGGSEAVGSLGNTVGSLTCAAGFVQPTRQLTGQCVRG